MFKEERKWHTLVVAVGPLAARIVLVGVLTGLAAQGLLPVAARDACLEGLRLGLFASSSRPSAHLR